MAVLKSTLVRLDIGARFGDPRKMAELNAERMLVTALKEICTRYGITLSSLCDSWVFLLQKGQKSTRVFGYDFEVNSAVAQLIAKDKAATSDLLGLWQVPRVEHRIFHSPQLADYVPMNGNWRPMLEYLEQCGGNAVCKPVDGTGGRGVIRVSSPTELEAAVLQTFRSSRSLCLSPLEDIVAEYRVIVFNGTCELAYRKDQASVTGDGHSTIGELLSGWICREENQGISGALLTELTKTIGDLNRRPVPGKHISLNWRHNLGQGAVPCVIDNDSQILLDLQMLAARASEALGIALASVDIIHTQTGLRVLEVNGGIMMESLARKIKDGQRIATQLYDKIVCAALDIDSNL